MLKTKLLVLVLLTGSISNAQVYYEWAKSVGDAGEEHSVGIGTDGDGNVYTVGYFFGTVDFDPGAGIQDLTSAGSSDIFITKFNSAGNFIWARRIGGTNFDICYGTTVDAFGNVYTTGSFEGTIDFDPGAGVQNLVSAGGDVYISKIDANGNYVWAKSIGGRSTDRGTGIAVDASGNVYTAGCFRGTVDFDPGTGSYPLTSAGYYDILVSKLDAAGNFVWARKMGGANDDIASSIALDGAGNVYTTGTFSSTADFDPGAGTQNLTSVSFFDDVFISKLDAAGNFVWAKSYGNSNPDYSPALTVDASGNIYATGILDGTIDFDPGPGVTNLTSAGNYDVYVTKFNATGNFVWAKGMGGTGVDMPYAVVVDIAGNVYTTGYFQGTAEFDPGTGTHNLNSAGNDDIFISKLDASGNFVWAESMGGPNSESGYAITVNSTGKLYLTGNFNGTADLDPGVYTHNLTSLGSTDVFIAKYDLTGTLPLTLLQLQADNNDNGVQLQWQIAQTENIASFTIERSNDGKSFTVIGSVKNNYTFTDAQPVNGIAFYRLKMMDVDGRYSYSQSVSVRNTINKAALQLAPNPAQNVLNVQATGSGPVTVQVTDINGRMLHQQQVTLNGNTSFAVNVQQLLPGNYYLLMKGKQVMLTAPFIK